MSRPALVLEQYASVLAAGPQEENLKTGLNSIIHLVEKKS